MANAFTALANFAARHPKAYLGCCLGIGFVIRWHWAAGDIGRFLNPLFPLFS